MNILIPHSWLKEYLKTEACPEKIADCLSLCGPSVEKIIKTKNDRIYDIEITTNRIDCMSIVGIAREASAILPQFKIKASLKNDPYKNLKISNSKLKTSNKSPKLKVIIKNQALCPRFTAIILSKTVIKPSPSPIREKLKKVAIRPLNNAIDISNLLMHQFGQPVHVFDYDKIGQHKMIVRQAKKGEKITTLDGKTHTLPGKDIVIEDGKGRLIDLCGIMGGKNSAVSSKTKNVLLFVQNYQPQQIRQTSMSLAHRTQAATIFEKGVDSQLVMPTILKGIDLFKKLCQADVASQIIDIYPQPASPKKIEISLQLIKEKIGLSIQLNKVKKILLSLGFKTKIKERKDKEKTVIETTVPSWRREDVGIAEDIVEEVARIYGYHNLPSVLPPLTKFPQEPETNFLVEEKTKQILKNLGLTEVYTYSLQSKKEVKNLSLEPEKHLKLKNPLSKDWLFMRLNLIPSILSVLQENQGKREDIKIFELANVYLPRANKLPQEKLMLVLCFQGKQFFQLKGICQALFEELGIKTVEFTPAKEEKIADYWQTNKTAILKNKKKTIGFLGYLKNKTSFRFQLEEKVVLAYLDWQQIADLATKQKTYRPIAKYPPVVEDLTFTVSKNSYHADLVKTIKNASKLINSVKLISSFKNNKTFKIFYQDPKKNLTSNDVGRIRKKIITQVKAKGLGKLKKKEQATAKAAS